VLFLKAGCKDKTREITSKVLGWVLFTFVPQCFHKRDISIQGFTIWWRFHPAKPLNQTV